MKFIIFFICFLVFLNKFILINIKSRVTFNSLMIFHYNKLNEIKIRLHIFAFSFGMILFSILLLQNIELSFINKWEKNFLFIYLFHTIFTITINREIFNNGKYSEYIIELIIFFTLIILFIFDSDLFNKSGNYILNSMHKSLLEFNIKRRLIAFLFILSFIFLLSLNPISSYYKEKEKLN